MGWGATAKMKRIVCASATKLDARTKTADAVVYDMNAIGRSHFNYDAAVSPLEAVVRFWKYQIAEQVDTKVFAFHFDSSHLIPEERQRFLESIRYKTVERDVFPEEVKIDGRIYRKGQEPATTAEVKSMNRDFMPVSYARVWSSRAGKAKLWGIIAELLQEFAETLTAKNTCYIIEPPQGGRITIPNAPSSTSNWGEADQKAVALTRELTAQGLSVAVCTIDWDMIIAGVCVFPKNVHVKIARLYQDKETKAVYYSATGAKGKLTERVYEYVYPAKIGPPSVAWWLLAIGGVDYCKGLTRFGFSANEILEMLQEHQQPNLIIRRNDRIGIDLPAIFRSLRGFCVVRRKISDPVQFVEEIKAMTFCMLYFLGCGHMRPRAGPDMSTFHLDVSGCSSIEDVLRLKVSPFYHSI